MTQSNTQTTVKESLPIMHLRADLWEIPCHATLYMKQLGIDYVHATPQSLGDCWQFWCCSNVPEPLPKGLTVLNADPQKCVGYGLSQEDANKIVKAMKTCV